MAKDSKRLSRKVLAEDEEAYNALQKIEGYAPSNQSHSLATLKQSYDEMRAAQAAEDQLAAAYATGRDLATSKEVAWHNQMLGAKDSIRAQFGKDSPQVQELGLKRASDYQTRGRKSASKELPK